MARYLISGATRGIGRALLDALDGHELIAVGRPSAALDALPVARTAPVDLADPSAVYDAVRSALGDLDRLDGVVHSAGVAARASLATSDAALWRAQLDVNVVSVAELTRALLPALRAARGAVVIVNSGQGRTASPNSAVYAATKFAVRALADSLRGEEPDLRVTSVYPGRVATEMQRKLRAQEGGVYEPERYLDPVTVARVIAQVLDTPPDAVVPELVLTPRHP